MYHNLNYLQHLDIIYDASTFDTDPFEPQPDGCSTLFPFWVQGEHEGKGYVELPYTLPQDFTLFNLLKEQSIEVWKKKLDWVVDHGGMALLITHPDYMRFDGSPPAFDEYSAGFYRDFLQYISEKYEGLYWHVLPREMAQFCAENYVSRSDQGQ